ncbi:MAG TPA: GAF domain-containing protein [Solirubrobacteraceae bacterium]|nr:GAF domain-containing protein [Solirubrobacteraceae bacterium]
MSGHLNESHLRRLMEAGPTLISELDLETVLDRLLEIARDVTGARYAAVGVLDDTRTHLERFLTRGLSDEAEARIGQRPRGSGILGLLVNDPRGLRLADLTQHPSSSGFPAGHPPMRSFLGTPLLIAGEAWGNLYLTDKIDGDFDAADEEAVSVLASWAAIAIEHARLMAAAEERQEELTRALRGLEATQAIAVALGAETDLARVLELIAKRGRAIVHARSVVILLQDGDDLRVAAGAGHNHPAPDFRMPITASTSGEVMLGQRSARVTDVADLQVPAAYLGVPEAQSALMVPLVYRGRSLGVLSAFDRDDSGEFTEDDEQVLVSFAASAATAVATAQTVQADRLRHSLEAAEAERRYWARELHDETLQTLGALKVLASAARRGSDPEVMTRALDQLVDGLESGIGNLHSIISELRPAALDDLGLRPAIEALAEQHRERNGLDVVQSLALPDPAGPERRLAPELETTVYRLIQEALTNVAKHAGATHVQILAAVSGGSVRIEVTDDGTGFRTESVSSGFGLAGMRERVSLAGGSLDISSSGEGGTTVTAILPARYAG